MPFLFRCAACRVVIRVPDGSTGRMGACPQCHRRQRIPLPNDQLIEQGTAVDTATNASRGTPSPTFPFVNGNSPVAPSGTLHSSEFPDEDDPISVAAASPAVAPNSNISSKQKSLNTAIGPRSRSPRTKVLFGASLLLFVGLVTLGIFLWPGREKSAASAVAERKVSFSPPPTDLSDAFARVPANNLQSFIEAIEKSPVRWSGTFVDTVLVSESQRIRLQASLKPEAAWFKVRINSHPVLSRYLETKGALSASSQQQALNTALPLLVQTVLEAQNDRASRERLGSFRHTVALNGISRNLAAQVAAKVGQQIIYCSHEDPNGDLYFALPQRVTQFLLVPRPKGTGPQFPQEIVVRVDRVETTEKPQIKEESMPSETPADRMPAPGMSLPNPDSER